MTETADQVPGQNGAKYRNREGTPRPMTRMTRNLSVMPTRAAGGRTPSSSGWNNLIAPGERFSYRLKTVFPLEQNFQATLRADTVKCRTCRAVLKVP
jgi:hypothetical protein